MEYSKLCEFLCKEIFLNKDNFLWVEFQDVYSKMRQAFIPNKLHQLLTDDQKKILEMKTLTQGAIIIDENNFSQNQIHEQKISIKYIIILVKSLCLHCKYYRYIDKIKLPHSVKERLQHLFNIKKRYFYEELQIWLSDLASSNKEIDEILMKNSRIIYERLSKNNYKAFVTNFSIFIKNIIEDTSSNGNYYEIKFYVNKY